MTLDDGMVTNVAVVPVQGAFYGHLLPTDSSVDDEPASSRGGRIPLTFTMRNNGLHHKPILFFDISDVFVHLKPFYYFQ